jgi:hypothetical protein
MIKFSETKSLVEFLGSVGATGLQICESKKTGGLYVVIPTANGDTTAMLAKSIPSITADNAGSLQVSWISGTTDEGKLVEGFMIHPSGERVVKATFSLADLTAKVGI